MIPEDVGLADGGTGPIGLVGCGVCNLPVGGPPGGPAARGTAPVGLGITGR